jgi:hypothetical protein
VATADEATENAVLHRIIAPGVPDMTPEAARAILAIKVTDSDRQRLHELLVKNQSDGLTADERQQLDAYLRMGRTVELLMAKARLALKSQGGAA